MGAQRSRLPASGSCPSVVMKFPNNLTCEVMGPTSLELTLSLNLEEQAAKVSKQQKLVSVVEPEDGTWQCLLSDKDKVLLASKVEGE